MSLTRTPLAAISYNDASGLHIRVYYQAPNGDIKEASFDEGSSWAPSSLQVTVGTGKLNTGIAAITWSTSTGQSIRVFYLAADSTITERNKDGTSSWSDGALTGKFKAAPYSKIAAAAVQPNDSDVRVYYQDGWNDIKELLFTPSASWHEGATLHFMVDSTALIGSALAATVIYNSRFSNRIWLYYQEVNFTRLKMLSYHGDSKDWETDTFITPGVFPPGASVSSVRWNTKEAYGRTVSVDENNKLYITSSYGGPTPFSASENTITLSDVAVISVDGSTNLRVFYQQEGGAIAELASADGDTWSLMTANILG